MQAICVESLICLDMLWHDCWQYFSEVDRPEGRQCVIAVDHIDILERDEVQSTIERFKQDVDLVFATSSSVDSATEPPTKKARTLAAYPSDPK